ncbi:hypothetical protein ACWC10_06345 [Streptomyces sp. NPDC001595]|uniref:hypothetical protein n=1 Tax=Streptomyces sp. NPDC001532 TaxID=3154520 RepID=UPI00333115F8
MNVVLCLAAVAGTGFGGSVLWDEWRTHREVADGCAGLVAVDDVRDMDYAERDLRQSEQLDLSDLPSSCTLRNAGTGDRRYGIPLLRLRVDAGPERESANVVTRDGFERPERWQRMEVPAGGGVPALVGTGATTVRLGCPDGTYQDGPVGTLEVTARAAYTGLWSYEGRTPSEDERHRVASVAVRAANEAAGKLGCSARAAALPSRLPAVPALGPAARATGTCAWYARLNSPAAERPWLPEQVMATAATDEAWRERCVLAMTTGRAQTLFDRSYDSDSSRASFRPGLEPQYDWWADVQTFYGQDTPDVYLTDVALRDADDRPVAPGTAGRGDQDGTTWWATSVCDGRPAVHVLRAQYVYARAAAPHLEHLFRAYVQDVTTRRDCTGLKFPATADFSLGSE